jgi:hypothetical protein
LPQSPSPVEYKELQTAGHLQLVDSPFWERVENGAARLRFLLSLLGLSLIRLAWRRTLSTMIDTVLRGKRIDCPSFPEKEAT